MNNDIESMKFIRNNSISKQGSAIIGDSISNFSTFPFIHIELYLNII
jgi:hypothetical protein